MTETVSGEFCGFGIDQIDGVFGLTPGVDEVLPNVNMAHNVAWMKQHGFADGPAAAPRTA